MTLTMFGLRDIVCIRWPIGKGVGMVDRIEIDPRVCGGKPVIRGTRIPVSVILDHLAAGESWRQIRDALPELSEEDVAAALLYARAVIEQTDLLVDHA